jgi:uncharacterized DUF497 family protein
MTMRFEWDFNKDAFNRRNHGVSFQEAVEVFADPNALETFDAEDSAGEPRWIRIGLSSQRLLLVVYVEPKQDLIRIIHARKAGPSQEKMYEENQGTK